MMSDHLAIIGGGASATLLLAQLARRNAQMPIDVYDRQGAFARGLAYSTPHACHLLNVRASNMSALADDPDDFVHWAAARGFAADAFVPRMRYGDYLHEHLERARHTLSATLIKADARSVEVDHGYLVNGKRYARVILASGNCMPQRPPGMQAANDVHDHPWRADYVALSRHPHIVILGSGLSAVDAVLALDAHGHTGRISLLSRHARLPGVHVAPAQFPAFMHHHPPSARAALRCVRREIKATDAPWQALIDSLRPVTNAIWQGWSAQEQQRFLRRLGTWWNIHRHRMAPQIGEKMTMLEHAGRLVRRRVRIERLQEGPVVLTDQGAIKADAVINCLGYRAVPAAKQMPTSHQIGPACSGRLFETTAIPEIRAQAAALAATLWP